MQKKTFMYVEDYLEYLAGFKTKNPNPISLARYDVQIVQSMASQTLSGGSLTDRQAELAYKLALKYKRQFLTQGVSVEGLVDDPKFRSPIRFVDRTKSIELNNDKIIIRFPYETKLIEEIRDSGKKVPGDIKFNKVEKRWEADLVEPRVQWLQEFSNKYNFALDQDIVNIREQIDDELTKEFVIELRASDNGYCITNAESSLVDYINLHLGGFDKSNLLKLVDYGSVLGYKVSNDLIDNLTYIEPINKLLLNKVVHLPISVSGNLDAVFDYAELTQRYPIVVYDPMNTDNTESDLIKKLKSKFQNDLKVFFSKQKNIDFSGVKCVYLNDWKYSNDLEIPLLVSLKALMIGPKTQHLVQYSEKVVFCTEVIYNNTL